MKETFIVKRFNRRVEKQEDERLDMRKLVNRLNEGDYDDND